MKFQQAYPTQSPKIEDVYDHDPLGYYRRVSLLYVFYFKLINCVLYIGHWLEFDQLGALFTSTITFKLITR